jgi:DNA polymerase, archaea type
MAPSHERVPAPKPGSDFDAEAILLAASYKMDERQDHPILELYCKGRDGLSFIAFVEGFMPYFHALEPPKGLAEELRRDRRVVKVEEVTLYHERKDRPALKITLHKPGETPEMRQIVQQAGSHPFASDIIFTQRFIFDKDLGACIRVKGTVRKPDKKYHTLAQVEASELSATAPFTLPVSTLCFDIENSITFQTVFCIGYAFDPGDGKILEGAIRGDEKKILEEFNKLLRDLDPDVVTGYNIAGYDIPHLKKRAEAVGLGDFTVSREGSPLKPFMNRFLRATGRILTDTWWNVKRELHPKQETLQAVAMELFGEGKGDVDSSKMDEEWKADPDKVVRYCIRDSVLCLRIHQHLRVMEKFESLAAVAKLPVDETINGRTSTLIDSILIRAADRAHVAVPMSRQADRDKQIEGGYVHALKPGIYNWVCVLDFKSMYPSIMIANNICFTTLVRDGSGAIKAPNGASYLSPEDRKGLLPQILKNLMAQRDDFKRLSREAKDKDEKQFYNGLQEAVKILMNSFYGVMASSFYRFTDPKIGESITAFARENIKGVIADLEKENLEVIYSDTDSVFFKAPEPSLEGAIAAGKRTAERYSKGGMSLEFEKVMNPFFSHGAKKRYVGKILWPREDVIYRGYEVRRTDAFDWQSEALNAVFERLFAEDIDGVLRVAKERVEQVAKGDVPKASLVISRSVRDVKDYESEHAESLQNVRVMRKLEERGIKVQPGMKVSWIVTGSKGKQDLAPYLGPESEAEIEPHWDFYARRVAQTLARVTEVFGWGVDDLLKGVKSRTARLDDAFAETATKDEGDDEDEEGEPKAQPATPKAALRTTGRPKPVLDKKDKSLGDFF